MPLHFPVIILPYQALDLLSCLLFHLSRRVRFPGEREGDLKFWMKIEKCLSPEKNVELVVGDTARCKVLQVFGRHLKYLSGLLAQEGDVSHGVLLLLPHVGVELRHGQGITVQVGFILVHFIFQCPGKLCQNPKEYKDYLFIPFPSIYL